MKSKIEVKKTGQLMGHKDAIYCLSQGPEEHLFYSVSGDGQVIEWNQNDVSKGKLIAKTTNSIYAIHFDVYSQHLLILENFSGLHIIDVVNKTETKALELSRVAFFSCVSTPNHIYVGSEIGELFIIDKKDYSFKRFLLGNKSIRSILFHENQLICGMSDNSIKYISLDGQLIASFEAHEKSIFALGISKNKNTLLSVSRDAHIKEWELNTKKIISDVPAHIYPINTISFSPNGEFYATGSMDKTIKIWDSQTHKLLKVVDKGRNDAHTSSVNSLLWTSYKNQLISCSDDRTIIFWSINIQQE